MKASVLIFAALCYSANGAEGYVKEVPIYNLPNEKPKNGEVWKIRQFSIASESAAPGEMVPVALYYLARHQLPEVNLKLTELQLRALKVSPTAFIRKSAEGWEYLGARVEKDKNGAIVYR